MSMLGALALVPLVPGQARACSPVPPEPVEPCQTLHVYLRAEQMPINAAGAVRVIKRSYDAYGVIYPGDDELDLDAEPVLIEWRGDDGYVGPRRVTTDWMKGQRMPAAWTRNGGAYARPEPDVVAAIDRKAPVERTQLDDASWIDLWRGLATDPGPLFDAVTSGSQWRQTRTRIADGRWVDARASSVVGTTSTPMVIVPDSDSVPSALREAMYRPTCHRDSLRSRALRASRCRRRPARARPTRLPCRGGRGRGCSPMSSRPT